MSLTEANVSPAYSFRESSRISEENDLEIIVTGPRCVEQSELLIVKMDSRADQVG